MPERSAEEDFLGALAAMPDVDLLADMMERAFQRAFMDGTEVGRREVYEEHGDEHAAACTQLTYPLEQRPVRSER